MTEMGGVKGFRRMSWEDTAGNLWAWGGGETRGQKYPPFRRGQKDGLDDEFSFNTGGVLSPPMVALTEKKRSGQAWGE